MITISNKLQTSLGFVIDFKALQNYKNITHALTHWLIECEIRNCCLAYSIYFKLENILPE